MMHMADYMSVTIFFFPLALYCSIAHNKFNLINSTQALFWRVYSMKLNLTTFQ